MNCNACKISSELSELKQLMIRLATMFRWFNADECARYMFTHMDIKHDIQRVKFPWEKEVEKSNKPSKQSGG